VKRLCAVALLTVAACESSYGEEANAPLPERDAGAEASTTSADASDASDAAGEGGTADGQTGSTVTGTVSLVNSGGFNVTSVLLVPETGFDPNGFHATVPAGPKATGVMSAFTIGNVPAGTYWVLPAFENDGLVLYPDELPRKVTVDGNPTSKVVLQEDFKVTGALAVVGIQPKAAGATITFADDSSEDDYAYTVVDDTSAVVASGTAPSVSGGTNVSITCAVPLTPGKKYRFRVIARRAEGEITRTEDLAGVFTAAP
jgi:hypothetical protein